MFNATEKYQKVNSGRTELSTFSQKTFLVNMVKFLTRLTMIQYEHYVCIYNIHTYIHAHFCLLILTRKIGFQNDCIFWLCPDYYRGTQDNIKSSCRFWKILIKKKKPAAIDCFWKKSYLESNSSVMPFVRKSLQLL